MCQFLSVLILTDGSILQHPMLDSHADLVTYFKLPDTNEFIPRFAKAELTPADDTWLTPAAWTWRIDEGIKPIWLTEDVELRAEAATRACATRMVLKEGVHQLIVDGCWVVGGTAEVGDVRGGRIVRVQGTARVSDVWGSARVSDVRGSAQVSGVRGSAILDASAKQHLVQD